MNNDEPERLARIQDLLRQVSTINSVDEELVAKVADAVDHNSTALEAIRLVYGEKRESYGDAIDNHERIANIMNVIKDIKDTNWYTGKQVALVLLAVKLARRQLHYKADTLIDAVGYTEILERFEKRDHVAKLGEATTTAMETTKSRADSKQPTAKKERKARMQVRNKSRRRRK